MEHDDTVGETALGTDRTVAGPAEGEAKPSELVEVSRSHYEVRDELARGGMGRILVARDRRIGRTVALKELLGSGDALVQRFEREALVTGRLQHPAIVPVYEAGRWPSGEPFYAMKLVAGTSLDKVIAARRTFAERLALLPNVIQICEAMAYAHDERVIHRDLKPANVLVGKFGETVVVDWGLAKGLDEADVALPAGPYRGSGDLTAAGSVMGTPMYMPPEQAEGESVDERADVYALGAMLYHVLTGGPPYRGESIDSILAQVVEGPPPAVASVVPGVPDELAAIVGKAMARDPGARYRTAKQLAEELVRFQAGQLVSAHVYSMWDLARRFVRRHRAAVIATAAIVVLGGAMAAIALRKVVAARDDAKAALAGERAAHAASLQEQGRRELYAGQPGRAAAYLGEAFATSDNPTLRLELALAMRSVDALIADVDTDGTVESFVVARDSDRLATTVGGKVELRTIEGKRIAFLPGARAPIAFAGDRVVTAMADAPAVVWDATDGRKLATLAGSAYVYDLDVAGERIYGAVENVVHAWSLTTGAELATASVGAESGMTLGLTATPHGVIVTTPDGFATLDPATLGERVQLHGFDRALANDAGSRVVVHNGTGYAIADPTQVAKPLASFTLAGDIVELGDRLLAIDPIRLVTETGTVLATYGPGDHARLSPDGSRVAFVDSASLVHVFDDRGIELVRFASGRHGVSSLAFDRTGARLIAASAVGLRIWRIPEPTSRPLATRGTLDERAISPDGKELAVVDGATVRVIELATGQPRYELPGTEKLGGAVFGSGRLATLSANRVVIWQRDHRVAELATLAIAAQFSPDGARLVTAGEDDAYVWDATTGARVATLAGSAEITTSARFSSDGKRIATASEDGTARIYDAATGTKQLELAGHGEYLVEARFDPSGAVIATASGDGAARLWDAATGKELHVLRGHVSALRGAAFSHDGQRLATVAAREACIWNVRTGALETVLVGDQLEEVAFALDDRVVVTASAARATLWDAIGAPIVELAWPQLAQPEPSRVPRHRDRTLALAPDGTWLVAGLQRFVLPRELRSHDELARRIATASDWRLDNGRLVPARDAVLRGSAVSTAYRNYDFVDDVVDGVLLRPAVQPPAELAASYTAAWAHERAGDHRAAYRALLEVAGHWPAPNPTLRAELFAIGAMSQLPPDELVTAIAATPVGKAPMGQLRLELAVAYEDLGDTANEDRVLAQLVGDPAFAAQARLTQAKRSISEGQPRELATHAIEALAVDASPDILARVRELALEIHSEFQKSWDLRYALAARRIYATYLATPNGAHDAEVLRARTFLDDALEVGPTAPPAFTKLMIRRAVRLHIHAIERCYTEALQHDPNLEGRVTARLTVENGTVLGVEAFADAKLEGVRTCVVAELRKVALPHAPGANPLLVIYPFLFRRGA